MQHPAPDSSTQFSEVIEFELGDGSRLILEQESDCRIGAGAGCISLSDTMDRASQPFAGYRYLGRNEVTA